MHARTCAFCGKQFLSISITKKYCCHECKKSDALQKREEKKQLCWRCKNACGGCSWSAFLKPVDGWDATPVIIKDSTGNISSYKIQKCPKFIKG